MKKYVLCIASGGFTDTLSQIQRAWHYCRENGRTLVIDTLCSSSMRAQFNSCFDVVGDVEVVGTITKEIVNVLNAFTSHPPRVSGNVYKDCSAGFDHACTYDEQCLVERAKGGTSWYDKEKQKTFLKFANCLKLQPLVSEHVKSCLNRLPSQYDAVHVRNTDYQTDYKTFFNTLRPKLQCDNLLVCSDDYDCVQYAKEFFTQTVWQAIDLTPNDKKPRHQVTGIDYHQRNLDLLCDLFALARAQRLHYTKCNNNKWNKGFSGFTMLAKLLHDNPNVISLILGE